MPRLPFRHLTLLLTLVAAIPARGASCGVEAAKAEVAWAIPPGLLGAIGVVESGRLQAGHAAAWPYSVNASGVGAQYATAAEAIAQVQAWQAGGTRSIDVGCFQVNLLYHPTAFRDLVEAFDPAANARAAARFLHDLRAVSTDWQEAAARYHSANPPIGQPYARSVMAVWGAPPAPPLSEPPQAPVQKPSILQAAVQAAGIHLPAVTINQPGAASRPAHSVRPQRG